MVVVCNFRFCHDEASFGWIVSPQCFERQLTTSHYFFVSKRGENDSKERQQHSFSVETRSWVKKVEFTGRVSSVESSCALALAYDPSQSLKYCR